MSQYGPHLGLEVAVVGGTAHRLRTQTITDPHYKDGRTLQKNIWPPITDCTGDDEVQPLSWGHARLIGATLCADCYQRAAS